MKNFIEKQYNQREPEVSIVTATVTFFLSIICLVWGILTNLSELISSNDPLNFDNLWMEAMAFELIFGVLGMGLLIDHWAYKTRRTKSALMFFNYIIGGIMFGFVAGTILIIVLTKVLGINCYNLYVLVPLFGSWCGMAFGIILHWKKPREESSTSKSLKKEKSGQVLILILLGFFFLSSGLFAQNVSKKEKEKSSPIEVYSFPREIPIEYLFPKNVKDSTFWQDQIIKLHIQVYDLEEANTKLRLRINSQEEQMNLLIAKIDSLSAILETKENKRKK